VVKEGRLHLYNLFWRVEKNIQVRKSIRTYTYKDNEKEGEQLGWYPPMDDMRCQLMFKSFYKDGQQEGEQFAWYSTGQLKYKHFYKDGKKQGEQFHWDRHGQAFKQF